MLLCLLLASTDSMAGEVPGGGDAQVVEFAVPLTTRCWHWGMPANYCNDAMRREVDPLCNVPPRALFV